MNDPQGSTEQLKRAYVALDKLKQRLQESEAKNHEPIAIVGMGCRFPGAADSPQAFWQLLKEGRDGLCQVPKDRWDMDSLYSEEAGTPGKMYTRQAAFVGPVGEFEPEFFGLSPREAKSMDPQQRLLLEVVWESLENAGIVPDELRETDTGMFLGIGQNDYGLLQLYSDNYHKINSYDGSGNGFCFASGRVSYVFGWQGPSLSVDTACSSSLVAVHLACQALRKRESRVAVAAGVQLMLTPNIALFLSRVGALAPDGRSKAFSADADGYGRGEGCGAVVLKRLSDAQADGDEIIALIRGSAVNHDGPGSGLTVPNGMAQQKLLQRALTNARVKPHQVSYVEAHGTGTVLGDPIEAEALGSIFNVDRGSDNPLHIGSVKSNVGHLETAAGIVSLIKTALAIQHRQIPASLNFSQPNPHIPWQKLNLNVPTQLQDWQVPGDELFAGVSSFGMSGTNAHLILQQAEPKNGSNVDTKIGAKLSSKSHPSLTTAHESNLLALSAKNAQALGLLQNRYAEQISAMTPKQLANLCYTAGQHRSHFSHRMALLVSEPNQAAEQLYQIADGANHGFSDSCSEWKKPRIAFLLTGQGAQFPAMGRQLYANEPVFRAAVDECHHIVQQQFAEKLPYSVHALLSDELDDEILKQYAQPALFVLQYALLKLWQSWGVNADYLIGHSVGEYAAACHCGIFSLADGLGLMIHRNEMINRYADDGAMVAVAADAEKLQNLLQSYQQAQDGQVVSDQLSIATINAPYSCVISGLVPMVQAFTEYLKQQGLSCQPLNVAHGFHSPAMQPALAAFSEYAEAVHFNPSSASSSMQIISTLTAQPADDSIADAQYWVDHIRQPVKFKDAILELLDHHPVDICLEIGPKPVLTGLAMQTHRHWQKQNGQATNPVAGRPKNQNIQWIKSLSGKNHNGRDELLEAAAQLYCRGVNLHWAAICPGEKVPAPTYSWERKYYWVDGHEQTQTEPVEPHSPVLKQLIQGHSEALIDQLWPQQKPDPQQRAMAEEILQRLNQLYRHEIQTERKNQSIYQIGWERLDLASIETHPEKIRTNDSWLVINNQRGYGAQFAEQIRASGQRAILLENGEHFQVLGKQHFVFPLSSRDDWKHGFELLMGDGAQFTDGIPSADGTAPIKNCIDFRYTDLSQASLNDLSAVGEILAADSALLYTLKQTGLVMRLWLVSQNAMSVNTDTLSGWLGAVAWGWGRVLAAEAAEFYGAIIDLPELSHQAFAEQIQGILSVPPGEQAAIRDQAIYLARLQAAKPQQQEAADTELTRIDQVSGDYLLTGGLGGLGLAVADWLLQKPLTERPSHENLAESEQATKNAGNLWLISRREASQLDAETAMKLKQLQLKAERSGRQVHVVAGDIADLQSLQQIFSRIQANGGRLSAIFHAAGILADGSIESHDHQNYEKLLQAKVLGAWNLHQLSQEIELDHFILFSSAAAVLGSPGQANYAAANAAMDALAHYRQQLKLPAQSINWGAWAEAGMVTKLSQTAQNRMQANGVLAMPSAVALRLLDQAMQDQRCQLMLMDMDWKIFSQNFSQSATHHFWQSLSMDSSEPVARSENIEQKLAQNDVQNMAVTSTQLTSPGVSKPQDPVGELLLELAELNPEQQYQLMLQHIENVLREVLCADPDKSLDIYQGFFDMGLDSMTVVELRQKLEKPLKTELPATLLFDFANMDELARGLLELLARQQEQSQEKQNPENQNQASVEEASGTDKPGGEKTDEKRVQALSEQELERLISDKLETL